MAANVESMMYRKASNSDIPWHKEGTPVPELATISEAITVAGLDWKVEKRPVFFESKLPATDGAQLQVPNQFVTVRTHDERPLGIVGKDYTPMQQSEWAPFFDELIGPGKACIETAGSLNDGKKIWMLAKLPGQLRIMGDDMVNKYLLIANGHDGVFNLSIGPTMTRVVCNNTLTAALNGSSNWMTVQHRAGIAKNVAAIGKLLKNLDKSFESGCESFQGMAGTRFSDRQAKNFFAATYSGEVRECLRAGRKWNGADRLLDLMETGTGMDLPGVRGTLWAAYNAVTEFEDYTREVKETTSRLGRNWFGVGATNKLSAFRNASLVLAGKASFDVDVMEPVGHQN